MLQDMLLDVALLLFRVRELFFFFLPSLEFKADCGSAFYMIPSILCFWGQSKNFTLPQLMACPCEPLWFIRMLI